jgi:glycosyltransferase involved in cell wall biosynthesis
MRADWDLRAARKIRARARTWRADLVHAHDARSHALALLALLGSDTPLVVTRRVPFTPRSARVKYGGRVARFIAISNAVRDAMTAGGIDGRRIDVVHSGVPIPEGDVEPRDWRSELGWPTDAIICGIVGAMTAEKGIDVLERAGEHLPSEIRRRTRLVLLGGEARGVTAIGGIEGFAAGFVEEIYPAMAGLDVLWHPSRAEGFGTAVLDAMALGIPPIAFAVGGLSELIADGETGLLVPPADAAGFAAAASALVRDTALRQRLGAGARARARAFDVSEMTKGTEAVYYRVLSG